MPLLALYTTVADEAAAERLARAAVEQRLAACVQWEPVRSVYRWDGAVQCETELRLLFKTTDACHEALRELILRLHPYELPALWAQPVAHADAAYARWVADQAHG